MSYLIIELETQLLKTGKTSADLIRATGHTPANISKLRNGKIKAIRLKTLLDICDELDCQPGDIIQRVSEKELEELIVERAKNVVRQMRDGGGIRFGSGYLSRELGYGPGQPPADQPAANKANGQRDQNDEGEQLLQPLGKSKELRNSYLYIENA